MDVVPVVFGSGKRYIGPVDGQHLLEVNASAGVAAALFAQNAAATAPTHRHVFHNLALNRFGSTRTHRQDPAGVDLRVGLYLHPWFDAASPHCGRNLRA